MSTSGHEPPSASNPKLSTVEGVLRVAIVDDNDMVRNMLVRSLRDAHDIEVVGQAGDGLEAIDVVRETRPHAVIMDLQMPRMDGVSATRQIKAEFPEVTVIAFSSETSLRDAVVAAGASDFFAKDARTADLVKRLRQLARQRESREADSLPPTVREIMAQLTGPAAVTQRRSDGLPVIIYVNDGFVEFTGYQPADVVGQSADFWLSFGVGLDDWTEIGTRLRAGHRVDKDVRARRKNGSRINVHFTMLPFVSGESLEVITIISPRSPTPDDEPGRTTWDHHDLVEAVWEALYQGASPDELQEVVEQEVQQAKSYLDDSPPEP